MYFSVHRKYLGSTASKSTSNTGTRTETHPSHQHKLPAILHLDRTAVESVKIIKATKQDWDCNNN